MLPRNTVKVAHRGDLESWRIIAVNLAKQCQHDDTQTKSKTRPATHRESSVSAQSKVLAQLHSLALELPDTNTKHHTTTPHTLPRTLVFSPVAMSPPPPIRIDNWCEDPPEIVEYHQGENVIDFKASFRRICLLEDHEGRGDLRMSWGSSGVFDH
jgi:hypothetical protein